MSERWQADQLGKYCYIKARIGWRGLAASEYTESGPFLIAGKHIQSGRVDWDAADHISEFRYRESSEIALAKGDVILSKDGTIGRVARVDTLPGEATINGTMMLVRPVRGIDYRFLYHILNGAEFKKLIDDKVSGSSIPHIFQRDMVTLPLSFPPIAHQMKLAEVLDTLDTAIHETEAIIAKLKAVKQGLLHDLLTRGIDANGELRPPQAEAPHLYKMSPLGWIPDEWNILNLGYCAEISSGVTLGRILTGHGLVELPYLRVANVQDGYVDLSDVRTVQVLRNEVDRFALADGDVLMNEGGDYDKLGRGTVWRAQIQPCLHQNHVFRVRCNQDVLVPDYLAAFSASPRGKAFFIFSSKQSTNLASINSTQLRSFPISCPHLPEQRQIIERLATADGCISVEEIELQKLLELKSALMDDLLTGRVRVTPLLTAENTPKSA